MTKTRKGSARPTRKGGAQRSLTGRVIPGLGGRLLQAQDDERRRLAHELHGGAGQSITALQMNLGLIAGVAEGLEPRAHRALSEAVAMAQSCALEIRALSYELYPPLLDEVGLTAALRAHAERYIHRTGIAVQVDLPETVDRLPPGGEIAVFRMVEEGLENIQRHSGSRTAILRLKPTKRSVVVEIIDHGRGMAASAIGIGLAGIRERARMLGGRFRIVTGEKGTTLRVELPIAGAS